MIMKLRCSKSLQHFVRVVDVAMACSRSVANKVSAVVLLAVLFNVVNTKVYEPCELAKELIYVHKFAKHEIADWLCLVDSESSFRTHVIGPKNWDGSHDHGLFQVSDCK